MNRSFLLALVIASTLIAPFLVGAVAVLVGIVVFIGANGGHTPAGPQDAWKTLVAAWPLVAAAFLSLGVGIYAWMSLRRLDKNRLGNTKT